ncbi:hypothetical protein ACGFYZ_32375 [Streptomyces sp. NPDC048330]|uniref:hypothetical protein n=1 Tax=Streptomyces sp. NPDC048330 TaxID=3365533 RepID=UPI003719023E
MPAPHSSLDLAGSVRPGAGPAPHRDFLVDGRALLHRLDEVDGVDAVSPLAADLPPTVRARDVRGLLAADGSRRVIHSCPECDDPGCGAVTAVVERAGEDVVWRDLAWQTGPSVDPERDVYPGVGPFRFRGAAYRAVLHRMLGEAAEGPADLRPGGPGGPGLPGGAAGPGGAGRATTPRAA